MTQRNMEKTGTSPLRKFRGKAFLFRTDGETRFYDDGPYRHGYLVPDSQREWELQDAIPRFELAGKILSYVMLIPAMISIASMQVQYSDRMLAALSVSVAIVAIGRVLQRNWYFGNLTAGLARTEPLDSAQRRRNNLTLLLIGVGYLSFVSWRILMACGVAA